MLVVITIVVVIVVVIVIVLVVVVVVLGCWLEEWLFRAPGYCLHGPCTHRLYASRDYSVTHVTWDLGIISLVIPRRHICSRSHMHGELMLVVVGGYGSGGTGVGSGSSVDCGSCVGVGVVLEVTVVALVELVVVLVCCAALVMDDGKLRSGDIVVKVAVGSGCGNGCCGYGGSDYEQVMGSPRIRVCLLMIGVVVRLGSRVVVVFWV